jgi:tripartite-type tricarboxylate transporter receptor subunit TctC
MKMVISRRTVTALASLALLAGAAVAFDKATAQSAWPARPVTLIVPYAPGASNDTFTRAIAGVLSKKYGQPFVVENRPGAGGYTATSQVQRANPDGYTFLEMPNGIASYKLGLKVDFDPSTDLTPLSIFARAPTAMVIPSALPVKTVQEFIDYAKKNPESTYYGYTGIGTTQHIPGELFNQLTGLKMRGINYKSSSEAQTDLLAGRLQVMFITVASVAGQIAGGQLRLLSYTADSSPPSAPKAPLMSEVGIKGMESQQIWWGFFAPKGMSPDILKKMSDGINEALKDPAVIELFAKSGASPTQSTLESAAKDVKDEVVTYARIVNEAGIKFE